jgi:ketosteroid isomerase-like protein
MSKDVTAATRKVIDEMYGYYLSGNQEGMLSLMSDDAVVTFVGHGTFHGKDEIRTYLAYAGDLLQDLEFKIGQKIVDGEYAAVTWDETATTWRGEPWVCSGVDVYHVFDGKIVTMAMNSDSDKMLKQLGAYEEVQKTSSL